MIFIRAKNTINLFRILFLSMVFFLSSGCTSLDDKKNEIINSSITKTENINVKAKFYIGGLGGGYQVIINNNNLLYKSTRNVQNPKWVTTILSIKDIANLETTFINNYATNWKKEYIKPNVQDGTYWSLAYTSKNISINTRGYNSYPQNYKKVIKYISSTLLKGKIFQ